jgi:hypothetical protein
MTCFLVSVLVLFPAGIYLGWLIKELVEEHK